MARRSYFTTAIPKSEKTRVERHDVWSTPLALRTRIGLDDATRAEVRRRLGRKLQNYAEHIDRVSLRFEDVNGPRGGVGIVCRIKVVLRALPSVVVEKRGAEVLAALGRATEIAGRAVCRALLRAGWSLPHGARARAEGAVSGKRERARSDDDGSLIGRRVGRGPANLELALTRPEKLRRDVYVDTAAPGVSASDRCVGYGATAARNTKRNTAGMATTLEDSRTKPSRKSTRKSKNRAKSGTLLARKAQLKARSPSARARGAEAHRDGARSTKP